ncbi:MAG: HDOD domain-containing protein [Sulfuriferula sp.]
MSTEQMKTVLGSLHQLPAIPSVVLEVIDSFANTEISTALLANKISQDQAISAKLLQVSNSSFYGLSRQIGSIHEAVIVLGFDSVRTLTVAVGLIHSLSQVTGELLSRKQFWQYNIQVASCAQFLAKNLGQNPEIAFTSGLLHDIGQMAMALAYPDLYGRILDQGLALGDGLVGLELSEFGFDHAMLGAEVAKHWNFPIIIQEAIKYHHTPGQNDKSSLADIVYAANFLHEQYRENKSEAEILSAFPEIIQTNLGLQQKTILAALATFKQSDPGALFFS